MDAAGTDFSTRGPVQALNAVVFLYGKVLGIDLPQLPDIARAKRPAKLAQSLGESHGSPERPVSAVLFLKRPWSTCARPRRARS